MWACWYHTLHNPGANWLIIRDTWENLRKTTLQEFFHWFPPGQFGEWKAGDKEFVWNTAKTGLKGRVMFMGVETPDDATKIASMPLGGFAIDEPSSAAGSSSGVDKFVFETAMAQLRQPGMKWYAAKLAQNNPDETHWTYSTFYDPGTPPRPGAQLPPEQTAGYQAWQTKEPENLNNLPTGYYEKLEQTWKERPDLLRRFVQGKHGYQQVGKPVTPEWSDELHLATGLKPVKNVPLWLLWDGGLNPTCLITQVTPMGDWLVLESHVGDGYGMFELIEDVVKQALASRYRGFTWQHTGDPNLKMREQSSSAQSAAKLIKKELGGVFRPGPVSISARVDPLQAVLRKVRAGRGVVQVDRHRAKDVWHALRGGWHRKIARTGQVGDVVKNASSHPGDACLAAGTMVWCRRGDVPVEQVQVGDQVRTPFGWRTVVRSGQTGCASSLVKVRFAQRQVVCTPDHLIFTQRGLVRADSLGYGDTILTDDFEELEVWNTLKSLSLTVESTGFTGAIIDATTGVQADPAISTEPYGSITTVRSPKATTSITSTTTPSTTGSRIWSAFRQACTTASTLAVRALGATATLTKRTWGLFDLRPLSGIEALKVDAGMPSTSSDLSSKPQPTSMFASSAESDTSAGAPKPHGSVASGARLRSGGMQSSITSIVDAAFVTAALKSIAMSRHGHAVESAQINCDEQAVYDLTVEGDHCYFAGGLLVKNCGYGAAILFPLGRLKEDSPSGRRAPAASYFNTAPHPGTSLGMARRDILVPSEAKKLGGS